MAGETASNAMTGSKEKMSQMLGGMHNKNYMHEMSGEISQQNIQSTQMVQEIFQEMREEREQYKNMFQEMLSTMKGMQDDISSLKANQKRNNLSHEQTNTNNK